MLGKIGRRRIRGRQRMRWLDGITDLMERSLQALGVGDGQGGPWGCKELDTAEQLNCLFEKFRMARELIVGRV